jgi:hypothetical protein
MDLMNELSGLLQKYTGAQPDQGRDTVHDDFDQVAQAAPQPAVADGLAAAFRSDQTPNFGQMTSNLYNNSNPQQRAGLLNTLVKYAGPAILSHVMSRGGSNTGGSAGGGLSTLINLFKGGQQEDPSIIDHISNFYSEHPTLVKSLGTAALTIALAKIAQRQYGG